MATIYECDGCGDEIQDRIETINAGRWLDPDSETFHFHPDCFERAVESLRMACVGASGADNNMGLEWRLMPIEDGAAGEPEPEPIETGGTATRTKTRTHLAMTRELVQARPGMTITELAQVMNVKANVLYRVLPQLVQAGDVRKVRQAGKSCWYPA